MYEQLARFLEALRDWDTINSHEWVERYGAEFGFAFAGSRFSPEFTQLCRLLADADPVLDMLRGFDEGEEESSGS
jgi:hypothetical protein